jgi:hypothetical protein
VSDNQSTDQESALNLYFAAGLQGSVVTENVLMIHAMIAIPKGEELTAVEYVFHHHRNRRQ